MNSTAQPSADGAANYNKAVDRIQQYLTEYACTLAFTDIPPDVVHGAKLRIIDTLGALVGGFFAEPSRMARNVAGPMRSSSGATIIGTRIKVAPEMAAFVNASTARFPEMTDSYHWPGSSYGHPSDVITPALAAAEYARADGRHFILAVVLAYEIYLRISNAFHNLDFDHANFCCIGVAAAAARLFGLNQDQVAHCLSMAAVPNVVLRQVRTDPLSMWKAVASGSAGRAGVFAALLARAGMEGPHLPFEGKAGWCAHVAKGPLVLESMGGHGTPFKIMDTRIKLRPSSGEAQSAIIAAEKLGPLRNVAGVRHVLVELYGKAKLSKATGEHQWNPDTHETADHSVPYLVAAALIDGNLTLRAFNDAHLWNPELRGLMKKIEAVENPDFTKAYEKRPVEHRTRITVTLHSGEKLMAETGADQDDMSTPKSDTQIENKFRGLAEDALGADRVSDILKQLWSLESMADVAAIPSALVIA